MPLRLLSLLLMMFISINPLAASSENAQTITRHWLNILATSAAATEDPQTQQARLILDSWLSGLQIQIEETSFLGFDEEGLHIPRSLIQRTQQEQFFEITRATVGALLPELSMEKVLFITKIYVEKAQEMGLLRRSSISSATSHTPI